MLSRSKYHVLPASLSRLLENNENTNGLSKSCFKLGLSRHLDTFNSEFIRLGMLHLLVGHKSDHCTKRNFHKHNFLHYKKLSWSEGIPRLKTFQLKIQTHVHAHTLQFGTTTKSFLLLSCLYDVFNGGGLSPQKWIRSLDK